MISPTDKQVYLSDVISKNFYSLHKHIKNNDYTHYFISGGRGSCKSSFVSIQIILGLMKDKNANAVVLRKVGLTLKESVFEQIKWAIDILCVGEYWQVNTSPLSLTIKSTGQKIIFKGTDNPQKIKSIKFNKGYTKYIWYEELDEFSGIEEIRNINQSLMRGGDRFNVFYSFNPPKSTSHWVNSKIFFDRNDSILFKTTYLDVPKNFLGETFFIEADHLKKVNIDAYKHEYLGIAIGDDFKVFKNITLRKIEKTEKENFKTVLRGIDWGYASDPFVYLVCGYDNKYKRCYIYYEFYKVGAKFKEIVDVIKGENKNFQKIIADSAEPRSNDELKSYGLNISPAKKGAGSVDFGINFLTNLEEIVIDPYSCPNTAREFNNYSLKQDSFKNPIGGYLDKDNHTIDALRYALNQYMKNTSLSFN